ncbi:Type IV pilus biogenesis protein PilE [Thauera humireducens]|uniref:type IV pilin protein n=1 Tax=Thauera humireducens TaxID=1134435 RepID=UPI002467A9BB|nr:type IV pilin protein [Thauera humireducens]CAH1748578.1 Type IV pilus biogenesis protein PilE [Thauera humireducens]
MRDCKNQLNAGASGLGRLRGFTLIEVMIVVVIIGVLAAIAVPNYNEYLRKTRRVDAKNLLLEIAGLQEQFMLDRRTYTDDLRDLGFPNENAISPEGYYEVDATEGACGDIGRCFELTATPLPGLPQATDLQCTTLTVTSAGARTATGTLGNDCW